MAEYKNKRVLIWKKGDKTHLDEVMYPQSACMGNFKHIDIDGEEDEQSDDLFVTDNIKITLEWD